MGRHSTIPDLFEDCRTITISKLKEWGYLNPDITKSGYITWSRQDVQTAKIYVNVNMANEWGSLSLEYTCNKEPVKYDVAIISKRSNLGKGLLWFFVCPETGQYCRKLHLGQKYFFHRTAFKGYIYELQTWSKNTRIEAKTVYKDLLDEKYYEEMYCKHFKKHYRGMPTKRFVRLLTKIGECPRIGYE